MVPSDVLHNQYPLNNKYERASTLTGILRISKNRGSEPGCKLHFVNQRDPQLSAFLNKTVVYISHKRLPKWYDELMEFMAKQD